MKYFTPQEIYENKGQIAEDLNEDISWATKKDYGLDLLNKYAISKDIKILDSGCGAGMFSKKLDQEGYKNCWLTDIDDYLVYPELKGRFKKADFSFEKLDFSDNFFDIVASFQVIEHLENQFFYIREISRVLNSGGILLLSMPNSYNFRNRLEYFFRCNLVDFRLNNNHISFMTKDIFKKTIEKYFSIEEVVFTGFNIPYRLRFLTKLVGETELTSAKTLFVLKKK